MPGDDSTDTGPQDQTKNQKNQNGSKKNPRNNNRKPPRKNAKPNHHDEAGGPEAHKAVTTPAMSEQTTNVEMCLVCADDIVYFAHYPCNHSICHKCAMRMRALMHNDNCALCRTEQKTLIITATPGKKFDDFELNTMQYKDDKLGVYYDSKETRDNVQQLLKFNCPLKRCGSVMLNWRDLKSHVRQEHEKSLCEICCRHKKAFTVEFELYTHQQLLKHERDGDKRGFPGHPECGFCRKRFYSEDELFHHMRENHEKCFICERQHPSKPQYYKNYDSLETHFKDKHFACLVQGCLDEKFVVFGTKVELQDHMISKHPEIIGKSKAARRIEPTFTSSSSGNYRRNNDFQGGLSTVSVDATTTGGATAAATTATTEQFPELGSRPITPAQQPANVTQFHNNLPPADTSLKTMQKRIDERVRMWVNFNTMKFDKFRDSTDQFGRGKLSAKELIDEYDKLLDIRVNEMDLLVHETCQIYKGSPGKAKELKTAFKDYQERQAFPTLGGASSHAAAPVASSNTRAARVTTTAAPSWVPNRQPNSRPSNLNDPNAFPSLPSKTSKSSTSTSSLNKKMNTVVLSSPRPSNRASPSSSTTSLPVSRTSTPPMGDDFPSLPALKKKPIPPLNPVDHSQSAWSNGGGAGSGTSSPDPGLDRQNFVKKGKKKVVYRM